MSIQHENIIVCILVIYNQINTFHNMVIQAQKNTNGLNRAWVEKENNQNISSTQENRLLLKTLYFSSFIQLTYASCHQFLVCYKQSQWHISCEPMCSTLCFEVFNPWRQIMRKLQSNDEIFWLSWFVNTYLLTIHYKQYSEHISLSNP